MLCRKDRPAGLQQKPGPTWTHPWLFCVPPGGGKQAQEGYGPKGHPLECRCWFHLLLLAGAVHGDKELKVESHSGLGLRVEMRCSWLALGSSQWPSCSKCTHSTCDNCQAPGCIALKSYSNQEIKDISKWHDVPSLLLSLASLWLPTGV